MLEQRKPSLALRAGPGSVASDDISQPRQREAKFSVMVTSESSESASGERVRGPAFRDWSLSEPHQIDGGLLYITGSYEIRNKGISRETFSSINRVTAWSTLQPRNPATATTAVPPLYWKSML